MPLITPRTLKGFRDHLPESMLQREQLTDTVRRVYQSYGFAPIDTPALEYEEILLGKGSEETDKQVYCFEDHGGRRVALRFDLTVPLARFSAQHLGELGTPLKRYQIAPVWRGENTQKGRYREFVQCDFDTIGTKSILADIETALVIHDLFVALGCESFKIHINNSDLTNSELEFDLIIFLDGNLGFKSHKINVPAYIENTNNKNNSNGNNSIVVTLSVITLVSGLGFVGYRFVKDKISTEKISF